jgi:hypothetical protein
VGLIPSLHIARMLSEGYHLIGAFLGFNRAGLRHVTPLSRSSDSRALASDSGGQCLFDAALRRRELNRFLVRIAANVHDMHAVAVDSAKVPICQNRGRWRVHTVVRQLD